MSAHARLPVYVFPVRIQQGWGDVQEMANACWALARHSRQCELLSLRDPVGSGRADRRAQYVDPSDAGPVRFPPVRRVERPTGHGRAVILATWWGTTARRHDAEGSPLPGTLEPAVEAVRRAHSSDPTLIVSLEEFASDQSSREALGEAMRQAGWSSRKRGVQLRSTTGQKELELYHRTYTLARGGERGDVLHLVSTFSPGAAGLQEFPFLVPVGPFARRTSPRTSGPRPSPGPTRIVWYASPASSAGFARSLFLALKEGGSPVHLLIRPGTDARVPWPPSLDPKITLEFAPALPEESWRARWRNADLRIASGSQTLVETVLMGRPFLYFNGIVQGPGEAPRAFRREKLLSLTRALRSAGVAESVIGDLENFADGQNLAEVLQRALGSVRWRRELQRGMSRLPVGLPPDRRDGGRFLSRTVSAFAEHPGDAESFVAGLRGS